MGHVADNIEAIWLRLGFGGMETLLDRLHGLGKDRFRID